MRKAMGLLLLAGMAACDTTADPATGEPRTRWTIPLTQSNADVARDRWSRCIQFRSESFCERTLPGGRPPGIPPVAAGQAPPAEMAAREADP